MARQLSAFTLDTPRKYKSTMYPWDKWTNGKIWQLKRGEDFLTRPDHFRVTCLAIARRRGLQCELRVNGDTLEVRFRKTNKKAPAHAG